MASASQGVDKRALESREDSHGEATGERAAKVAKTKAATDAASSQHFKDVSNYNPDVNGGAQSAIERGNALLAQARKAATLSSSDSPISPQTAGSNSPSEESGAASPVEERSLLRTALKTPEPLSPSAQSGLQSLQATLATVRAAALIFPPQVSQKEAESAISAAELAFRAQVASFLLMPASVAGSNPLQPTASGFEPGVLKNAQSMSAAALALQGSFNPLLPLDSGFESPAMPWAKPAGAAAALSAQEPSDMPIQTAAELGFVAATAAFATGSPARASASAAAGAGAGRNPQDQYKALTASFVSPPLASAPPNPFLTPVQLTPRAHAATFHADWLVAVQGTVIHNGVALQLTDFAHGRQKIVSRINPGQKPILPGWTNEKLIIKRYKDAIAGQLPSSRANQSHVMRLKNGKYSKCEVIHYNAIKDVENEHFRVARAFFFPGYSLAEYIEHDPKELARHVASVQAVMDQTGFDALTAETKEIYAKIKAFFAFAYKMALEKGICLDFSVVGNLAVEKVGQTKRLVYLDNWEFEIDDDEALMQYVKGLKAFAGETSKTSFSPFIYRYLAGEAWQSQTIQAPLEGR